MFNGLRRYDDYKPTESPWIDVVPARWRMDRVKSLLNERVAKGFPGEALLAATQSRGVIRKADYGTRTVMATKDLHLLKLVDVGDFVISLRSFQGGIERCYHRGIISPAYTVLTAKSDSYRDYLTYLFKTKPFVSSLTLAVTGIREGQNIDYSKLSVELLPVPPADEQAAIVKYLANANARIDKAIAAKFRLIALLLEQRGSIARAIVRQAASEASLSVPSGLDWLGDVPSGWVKHRAKAILRDVDERSTTGLEEVLSVSHITGVTPRSEKQITMFEAASYVGHKLCRPDDLVVNTMWAWMAALGVSRHHGVVSPAYNVYRPMHEGVVDTAFLAYLLRSQPYNDMFRMYSTGVRPSRLRFYPDQMLATPLFLPPMDEQRRIVTRIAEGAVQADGAISRVEQEIDLLKEFRAHLVADVVTGQVDVRGIAASLPDIDQSASWSDSDSDDALELADLDDVIEASEV